MPRQSRERGSGAEANLARRVEYEREKRGLSYEALAKAMTDTGCKIQGSAIYKIEKAEPPRRITVDELTAFADVFTDGNVAELLKPMELVEQERAAELLESLQGQNRQLAELMGKMFNDFVDLTVVWGENEDIYGFVMGHFQRSPLGQIDVDSTSDDEPEDGAHDALSYLLSDIAARTWHAVSQVTLMYMGTLLAQESGEGPTEDELKSWVAEWTKKPLQLPEHEEARERLLSRVEDWTERMRAENG